MDVPIEVPPYVPDPREGMRICLVHGAALDAPYAGSFCSWLLQLCLLSMKAVNTSRETNACQA